jgi:hypothetical protein
MQRLQIFSLFTFKPDILQKIFIIMERREETHTITVGRGLRLSGREPAQDFTSNVERIFAH